MLILTVFVGLFFMNFIYKFMSGGFGDSTGAPLKSTVVAQYKGCNSTGCHTGKPVNDFTQGLIDVVSDIPISGWIPNTTYNFTVSAVSNNQLTFGFQVALWGKTDSASRGTMIANNSDVQLRKSVLRNASSVRLDSNYYITHRTSSVTHGTNNKKWTFQWTSPAAKNQEIRVFLAGICANSNGSTTGDYYYRINKNADSSSIPVPNVNAVGINEITFLQEPKIFPTITNDKVNIVMQEEIKNGSVQVLNELGQVIKSQQINNDQKEIFILLEELPTATYFIKIEADNFNYTKKIIKL